ncbi:ankyrin repeat-containing protein BDA1-like [Chenopodium quinoa]|uniref:PGG domain-containing protein n=1 Tax=Chenopodium quinoa TaxID=63459 RepID=A0A803LBL2_CHEQI|nr:ankyrin repeat-containing protein BDA1-like [Chenopodium quinoa]
MVNKSEITQTLPTNLNIYEVAFKGDENYLKELLNKDELALDRCIIAKSCTYMQSPLHIAVEMNHLKFLQEILKLKPKLAEVVDQIKRSTPLHIAAAQKGSLPIVQELLKVKPNMCFVHDQDGMTPLHVAAVNGNTQVLIEFIEKKRQAALERTARGETILHLCVKNCQLETLKALVEITYDLELRNSQDSDGNTVLHLAVAYKETEMVRFLLEQGDKIDNNVMNKKDKTIMDIYDLTKIRKDKKYDENKLKTSCWETILRKLGRKTEDESTEGEVADKEIKKLLKGHNTLRAEKVLKRSKDEKWLEEQNTALMVVASCIATLSFQVGINPPGSVWQDNSNGHEAGTSIMSYDKDVGLYNVVQVSNTIGLMSSLSVILLLISGLPCKRYFVFILRVTLWIAVTASAATYFFTIGYLTNELWDKAALVEAMEYSVEIWLWLMLVILFGHGLRFIWMCLGHKLRLRVKKLLGAEDFC